MESNTLKKKKTGKDSKIIALIPARGGSKGIPRKNVREFAGKPLIVHSIEQALSTPQIDAVYVSTDDADIAQISEKAGARIINRPTEISGDNATTESAIAHALDSLKSESISPDIIVLIQATSPLRPPKGLEKAMIKFKKGNYDSLLSISPIHRFFWRIRDQQLSAEYDFLNRPRRQDIDPQEIHYMENGSVYIFTREHFERTGNRLGGEIGYVIFPEEYRIEIDTEQDFMLAEKMAEYLKTGGKSCDNSSIGQ